MGNDKSGKELAEESAKLREKAIKAYEREGREHRRKARLAANIDDMMAEFRKAAEAFWEALKLNRKSARDADDDNDQAALAAAREGEVKDAGAAANAYVAAAIAAENDGQHATAAKNFHAAAWAREQIAEWLTTWRLTEDAEKMFDRAADCRKWEGQEYSAAGDHAQAAGAYGRAAADYATAAAMNKAANEPREARRNQKRSDEMKALEAAEKAR
jgi:hypothetical protein